jgi:hypothetical protein
MSAVSDRFMAALHHLDEHADTGPMVELTAPEAVLRKLDRHQEETGPEGARVFWDDYRSVFATISTEFTSTLDGESGSSLEWIAQHAQGRRRADLQRRHRHRRGRRAGHRRAHLLRLRGLRPSHRGLRKDPLAPHRSRARGGPLRGGRGARGSRQAWAPTAPTTSAVVPRSSGAPWARVGSVATGWCGTCGSSKASGEGQEQTRLRSP